MLKSRTKQEKRIFFLWEGRGGLRRFLARGRFGSALGLLAIAMLVTLLFSRERYQAGERRTYVALRLVNPAVERYLLENEGDCPSSLDEVLPYLERPSLPRDAWGRPLRLVCPSMRAGIVYELLSDGPDGIPGGLDRIEF